ncbi:MAG: response regulator [Stenomitos rutilans HA7619-LM2]|jgi:CheY-like chemotaxis protein|nr:response regulator [Stenomitos rutilans HA7619-LM2]
MNKRILVIDDEEALRELAAICLEDLGGWDVTVAASGHEGLMQAATHTPDAILLDVSMPDMDGFAVYEQLKADDSLCQLPVVLLTAKVLPGDRSRFAQMDVAGVITKPFDPTSLCAELAAILGWE